MQLPLDAEVQTSSKSSWCILNYGLVYRNRPTLEYRCGLSQHLACWLRFEPDFRSVILVFAIACNWYFYWYCPLSDVIELQRLAWSTGQRSAKPQGGWELPKLKSDNHHFAWRLLTREVISNFLNKFSLFAEYFSDCQHIHWVHVQNFRIENWDKAVANWQNINICALFPSLSIWFE